MESLPDELHYEVAEYLTTEQLCSYRLVSTRFAAIGARRLFRVLPFHASSSSLERIISASRTNTTKRQVRALLWDSGLWKHTISSEGELSYKMPLDFLERLLDEYCHEMGLDPAVFPTGREDATYQIIISRIYDEWLADCEDEESVLKTQLQSNVIAALLDNFQLLNKIYIMNGDFLFCDAGVSHFDYHPKTSPQFVTRGQLAHPVSDRFPIISKRHSHGVLAMQRVLEAFLISRHTLTKLRACALDVYFFEPPSWKPTFETSLSQLVSLRLNLYVPEMDPERAVNARVTSAQMASAHERFRTSHFNDFLKGLPNLQSLSLEFPATYLTARRPRNADPARAILFTQIGTAFPLDHSWPSLRKLSLKNMMSCRSDLASLLQRQRATLEILYLDTIHLYDGSAPLSHTIRHLGEILTLKKAAVRGIWWDHFPLGRSSRYDMKFNLNPDVDYTMGAAFADCLINGGHLGEVGLQYEDIMTSPLP